jgi:hypothetical protein
VPANLSNIYLWTVLNDFESNRVKRQPLLRICRRCFSRNFINIVCDSEVAYFTGNPASRFYCVGNSSCVNPVVLMSRNIGVRGGNKIGFRKLVSNWYARVGAPYTIPPLYTPTAWRL